MISASVMKPLSIDDGYHFLIKIIIQVSKFLLIITREREIHVLHNVHLSAGLLLKIPRKGWNSLLRVDLVMFQRRLSLCVAILTKCF